MPPGASYACAHDPCYLMRALLLWQSSSSSSSSGSNSSSHCIQCSATMEVQLTNSSLQRQEQQQQGSMSATLAPCTHLANLRACTWPCVHSFPCSLASHPSPSRSTPQAPATQACGCVPTTCSMQRHAHGIAYHMQHAASRAQHCLPHAACSVTRTALPTTCSMQRHAHSIAYHMQHAASHAQHCAPFRARSGQPRQRLWAAAAGRPTNIRADSVKLSSYCALTSTGGWNLSLPRACRAMAASLADRPSTPGALHVLC